MPSAFEAQAQWFPLRCEVNLQRYFVETLLCNRSLVKQDKVVTFGQQATQSCVATIYDILDGNATILTCAQIEPERPREHDVNPRGVVVVIIATRSSVFLRSLGRLLQFRFALSRPQTK